MGIRRIPRTSFPLVPKVPYPLFRAIPDLPSPAQFFCFGNIGIRLAVITVAFGIEMFRRHLDQGIAEAPVFEDLAADHRVNLVYQFLQQLRIVQQFGVAFRLDQDRGESDRMRQAREQRAPSYHVVDVTGPDHERSFTVEVRLGDEVLGTGTGRSKKVAETEAAQAVLERLSADFTP